MSTIERKKVLYKCVISEQWVMATFMGDYAWFDHNGAWIKWSEKKDAYDFDYERPYIREENMP